MNSIEKQLKKMAEKIEKDVSGEVTFKELFNNGFMEKYTDFKLIEELFNYCNLDIKTQEDYDNIPADIINEAIKEKSQFSNWSEMMEKASAEYTKEKLKKLGYKVE